MLISNIKSKDGIWRGRIKLNTWNDFFNNNESIELNIGGEANLEKIEERHILAYQYILNNQKKILKIILENLLEEYSFLQEEYGYDENEVNEYMPNVDDIKGFRSLLKPMRIYILDVENEGISYFGCSFFCSWDYEHDLGIMMWKDRIIKMGDGSIAFFIMDCRK